MSKTTIGGPLRTEALSPGHSQLNAEWIWLNVRHGHHLPDFWIYFERFVKRTTSG